MKQARVCILIATAIVFALLPTAPRAQAADTSRYGYTLLTNDTQKKAYSAIADGVAAVNPVISFEMEGITADNASAMLADTQIGCEMVFRDYPEYFWFNGAGNFSTDGQTITFTPEVYSVDGQTVTAGSDALTQAQQKLDTAIVNAKATVPANPSDYEIAHAMHDYLVDNVSYQQVGDHQSAYGALVSGKAVCAGYARAYQLLLNQCGIRSWYVSGESYDPNGQKVPHGWNLVWLDGCCYYTDVTWDDQGSELFHEYLNMSKEEISKTHFTNDTLPVSCGHDTYTFFKMNSGTGVCDVSTEKTADEIAACFVFKSRDGEEASYYCTIHYHSEDFAAWWSGMFETVAAKIGYTGSYSYSIIEMGLEHHVTFTGAIPEQSEEEPSGNTEPTTATEPISDSEPTGSTEAPTDTEPTADTQATDPTEATSGRSPNQPTKPTAPAEQEKPTEPVVTEPVADTEPKEGSDTQQPTEWTTPNVDPPATQPQTPSDTQQISRGNDKEPIMGIIVAILVAVVAAGGAVFLILRKRKY